MDGGVEQPLAPALGCLAVARILFDVGNQPRVEDRLAIRLGIEPTIQVERRPLQLEPLDLDDGRSPCAAVPLPSALRTRWS